MFLEIFIITVILNVKKVWLTLLQVEFLATFYDL